MSHPEHSHGHYNSWSIQRIEEHIRIHKKDRSDTTKAFNELDGDYDDAATALNELELDSPEYRRKDNEMNQINNRLSTMEEKQTHLRKVIEAAEKALGIKQGKPVEAERSGTPIPGTQKGKDIEKSQRTAPL